MAPKGEAVPINLSGKNISSRITEIKLIPWRTVKPLKNQHFKKATEDQYAKLKASIVANNFIQPLIVWQEKDKSPVYSLDGRYRIECLNQLEEEGYQIPKELPAAFIKCKDIHDAGHLSLLYSSIYFKFDMHGLFNFIEMFELDYSKLDIDASIPEIEWDKFIGHRLVDFSLDNEELDISLFTNEMKLVFSYPKDNYIEIRDQLNSLKLQYDVETIEDVLKILLNIPVHV
jgi:hypothetical protein